MRCVQWLFVKSVLVMVSVVGMYGEELMPIGTQVKIILDDRGVGEYFAKYVGMRQERWLLLDAKGDMLRVKDLPDGNLPLQLPEGFVPWDPKTQEWPGKPAGVLMGNPVFQTTKLITGAECFWEIVDEKTAEKFAEAQAKKEKLILDKAWEGKTKRQRQRRR